MGHFDDFIFLYFLFCCFNVPFNIVYLGGKYVFSELLKKNKKKCWKFSKFGGISPPFFELSKIE